MLEAQRRRLVIPFLLPFLVLYTTFWAVPVLGAIPVSLTKWDGISDTIAFTGLRNFQEMWQDELFWLSFTNTLKFVLITLVGLPLGLCFAVLLTMPLRLKRVIRVIMFAPVMLSVAATGLLWLFIYDSNIGLLNSTLRAVGLDSWAQPWLGRPGVAMVAISVVIVWQGLGILIILFLGGLERIPTDLYDAARIDGAGTWDSFRYITWPLLWEITRLLVLLHFIGGMQAFAWVYILTRSGIEMGGPLHSTEVMGIYLYRVAFLEYRAGYATAIGVVMLVLVISATMVMNRLLTRETVEF